MPTETEILATKNRIVSLINGKVNQMCSNDFSKCPIGSCSFHRQCIKPELIAVANSKLKSLRLKKKRVDKYYLKFKGRKSSTSTSTDLLKQCEALLLQPIFEHDLVKENEVAIFRIKNAKNMNQIIQILDDMYLLKYGKRKNLPRK